MRWAPDPTGRFPQRPYYDQSELDFICEQVMSDFLTARHGQITFPIETNDLTVLLERDVAELDLYADLSATGFDVDGVTDFSPGDKPRVRIAAALSEDPKREHRLRTTLTHEYGHVHLHDFLYGLARPLPLFGDDPVRSPTCKRETMLYAPMSDWMEWQAGYACGSLLMPISPLRELIHKTLVELGLYGSAPAASANGLTLIARVSHRFRVSQDAARVRLSQLRYLADEQRGPALPLD